MNTRLFPRFFSIIQSQSHFITRFIHLHLLLHIESETAIMADKSEVYMWLKSLSPGIKLERLSLQFESRGVPLAKITGYLKSKDLNSFFPSPDKLLLVERRVLEAELNNIKTETG